MQTNQGAWSTYWQTQKTHSFMANEADQTLLDNLWQSWMENIHSEGRILDLATGNGAAIASMLPKVKDHKFVGVDYADIDLPTHESIEFSGNTDITALPFADDSFQGITSQFGFEYADKVKAFEELVRVLVAGGHFQLVVHHAGSAILESNMMRLEEISSLVDKNGLLSVLTNYVDQRITIEELEAAGQTLISNRQGRLTKSITGDVFATINYIVSFVAKERFQEASEHVNGLFGKLTAEQSRLKQLQNVALDEAALSCLVNAIGKYPVTVSSEPLYSSDNLLLAWVIKGRKCDRS
ncbi:class I SAM-dependent methyltransferase [Thalassotalea euphylliae]|uniref:class I SAM-dependent methyltransferase n=1 Tax=Thalassotalea euphylliae TaxID=1655234 RepID=UPI00362A8B7F